MSSILKDSHAKFLKIWETWLAYGFPTLLPNSLGCLWLTPLMIPCPFISFPLMALPLFFALLFSSWDPAPFHCFLHGFIAYCTVVCYLVCPGLHLPTMWIFPGPPLPGVHSHYIWILMLIFFSSLFASHKPYCAHAVGSRPYVGGFVLLCFKWIKNIGAENATQSWGTPF